jgi:tetratricopeptide (TPR) repeat protein
MNMKFPALSANKVMIVIGGVLILLMVLSGGLRGYGHFQLAKRCRGGELDVCTALIESKQIPEKEQGMYYAIRGFYYDRKGDHDKAIADYSDAISRSTPQAALYANRAAAYTARAQYTEAIADYSSAIQLTPKAPGLFCGRAGAEYHKGDGVHGDADLDQAKKIDPRAPCIAQVEAAKPEPTGGTPPIPAPAQTPPAATP